MIKTIKDKFYDRKNLSFEELIWLLGNKDEAVPFLLEVLEDCKKNYKEYAEIGGFFVYIYAVYILGQFKEKAAFAPMLEIFNLPDHYSSIIFGEVLTESGTILLGETFDGNFELLNKYIENPCVNDSIHLSTAITMSVYSYLVIYSRLPRETAVEYFRKLLKDTTGKVSFTEKCWAMKNACDIHPGELIEEIRDLFNKNDHDDIFDLTMINIEEVEEVVRKEASVVINESIFYSSYDKPTNLFEFIHEWILESANAVEERMEEQRFIESLVRELPDFEDLNNNGTELEFFNNDFDLEDDFEDEETEKPVPSKSKKVGRNDPCPCGSGKKFKNCCGK